MRKLRPAHDFRAIADAIVSNAPGLQNCLPVVEKELLHVEILRAMHEAGLLRNLVFKGGTCLRLCYGADRFSEDLDFGGGEAFKPALLADIEEVLRSRIAESYGLEVDVRHHERKPGRTVDRWTARIVIFRPEGTRSTANLQVQRIKLEVDNEPLDPGFHTRRVPHPYREIVGGYAAPMVGVMPLDRILADKLVAFPASLERRRNPRYRDVWDMHWLAPHVYERRSVFERADAKAARQGMSERDYGELRGRTVERMHEVVESTDFADTLKRFMDETFFAATIGDPTYRREITRSVCDLLGRHTLEIRPRPPSRRLDEPPVF